MTDQSKFYEIKDGELVRTHRTCPKCGPGYFLADHYDRWVCGKCAHTIFKRKGKKTGGRKSTQRRRSSRKRSKSM